MLDQIYWFLHQVRRISNRGGGENQDIILDINTLFYIEGEFGDQWYKNIGIGESHRTELVSVG